MRRLFLFLFALTLAPHASANTELKEYADYQLLNVKNTIKAIDLSLLEAIDFLSRNPNKDKLILHDGLAQYVSRTPGLRAIIATDPQGQLWLDSFTYPAKTINLSDREYVQEAIKLQNQYLYIGKPVVGRSSGAAFLPFSRAYLDTGNNIQGVVAAIMHPGFLIKQDMLCSQCFIGVFNEMNESIVTYPSNTQYPADLIKQLSEKKTRGIISHALNGQSVQTHFVHIQEFGILLTLSKFTEK